MHQARLALLAALLSGCPDPTCEAGGCTDAGADADAGALVDAGAPVDAGPPLTCADFVVPLELVPEADGTSSARVTAEPTVAHSSARCGASGGGGRDVAWSFAVPTSGVLTVTATPGADRDVVLYLRAVDCFASVETACRDDGFAGAAERLQWAVPAGAYVLYLDEYSATGTGPVEVQVRLQPDAPPPGNDTCAAPLSLTFAGGEATAPGDTTFATPEPPTRGTPACSSSAASVGKDLVYAFTVGAGQVKDLSVVLTPQGLLRPVLSLTSADACSGVELACAAGERLSVPDLAEGSYFLWVDGRDETFGAFTLRATLSDPPPPGGEDTCLGALPVLASGTAESVSGTTRGNQDDVDLPCTSGGGKDVFYAFSTTTAQRFRAVATPTSPASFRPALAVLPAMACTADGGVVVSGAVACARGGGGLEPATLEASQLPAGNWLLVVDGLAGSFGTFDLELSLDAVSGSPANDTCEGAASLAFTTTAFGQRAQTLGSTSGAMNDHPASGSCVGAGPDVAYALPPFQSDDGGVFNVKASAWTLNAFGPAPTLFLQTACDGGVLRCAASGTNGAAVTAWGVAPGTALTLWAEGAADGGGPFALDVEVATRSPANDSCASPITLPFSATVAGNTLGATPEYGGAGGVGAFYAGPRCAQSLQGADLVYRFVASTAGLYTVRLFPSRTFDPGLAVTSACAVGACLESVDVGLTGDEERIEFQADAGSLYFVFVDSWSDDPVNAAARGSFGISVEPPSP